MAAWAGFSEEELKQVKILANRDNVKRNECSFESKEPLGNRSRSRPQYPASSKTAAKPTVKPPAEMTLMKQASSVPSLVQTESSVKVAVKTEPQDDRVVVKEEPPSSIEDRIEDLDDKEAMSRDLMNLEKFRKQQQFIEEANIQKKALLSKTLTERRKAAAKEAYKLEHIQKELAKLDTLLTADVNVVRSKIEDASREFMDAQRRFERAEAEYVAAKMELHNKQDLKEQLTEHLYAIIHQNEVRKAKKLAELMKSLEMEASGGEEEIALPELPPLTSFQPGNVLLSPTGVRQFAIHGVKDGHSASVNDSPNSQSGSGSGRPSVENITDRTENDGENMQNDTSELKSENCSVTATKNLQHSQNPIVSKTKTESSENSQSAVSEIHVDSLDNTQTSDTNNSRLENSKVENVPKDTKDNKSENKSEKSKKEKEDSSETAVDLSIVKKETVDVEQTDSGVPQAKVKTKWDFDGSLK